MSDLNESAEPREQETPTTPPKSTSRAFRRLMWAFLCFLPVRVPWLRIMPDFVGWAIVLLAVQRLVAFSPKARLLRILAVLGLAAAITRTVICSAVGSPQVYSYLGLYASSSLVQVVFVWTLCGLVIQIAASTAVDPIRQSAQRNRWLYLVQPLLPFAYLLAAPEGSWGAIALLAAPLLFSACIIILMMALMASTARMCETRLGGSPQ